MKLSRNILSTFFVLIVFTTPASAYVYPDSYKDVAVKFYYDIDKESCYNVLDSIPSEYFDGLNYLKIFGKGIKWKYTGYYWIWAKGIDSFYGCDKEIIIHELAHHCQMKKGDTAQQAYEHTGNFDSCYEEIWERAV